MIRKNKKALITLISAIALSMNAMPMAAKETAKEVKNDDIIVLYTNDMHCGIQEKDSMGIEGVAAYKAQMILENGEDNVTLVDCGDAIQGASLGTLSNGEYMVDIMNAVGYDYAIFGNHEFDFTIPQLKKLVEKAEASYLGCNFKFVGDEKSTKKEDILSVAPYEIKDYNGVKVAYVGVSTPNTLTSSTPTYFMDKDGKFIYSFCEGKDGTEFYSAVQNAVDAARKEGAKYVIALAHLGIEEDAAPYRSTDLIAQTTGIDVVLDGHSHSTVASEQVKNAAGEDVLLSQTGTKLANLGKLVISKDGKFTTELIKDYDKKDEATAEVVKNIETALDKVLNQVVAKSDIELSILGEDGARAVRNRETALGDLCADAYRKVSGADIALVNGGGIRANLKKGEITYNDIISVFPYCNELCVVEATGQEILDALELGSKAVSAETSAKGEDGSINAVGESGGFLQVSGLKYTIDTAIDSTVEVDDKNLFVKVKGDRRVKDVQVLNSKTGKYEPIKTDATYKVASHNYMLKNMGDGYTMFADNKLVPCPVMLDNQVLITYITETLKGTIGEAYAKLQGNITVLGAEVKADTEKKAA